MEKKNMTAVISRCLQGDTAAQEALVRAAQQRVYYHCRKMLKNEDRALDLTQDVLIDMLTGLNRLQDPSLFWTWLGGITANKCRNAINRGPRELQIPEDADGNSLLDTYETLDTQTLPETVLDNAETRRMIAELVDELPDAQRQCVLLYYYDEMSIRQIADCLQIPDNTVKSRLNYARKAIKEGVERHEKNGIKLYSLPVVPLLVLFLSQDAEASGLNGAQITKLTGTVVQRASCTAVGTAAAVGVGKGLLSSLTAKIIAGVLAAAVVVAGVTAATQLLKDPEPAAEADPAITVSKEEPPMTDESDPTPDSTPAAPEETPIPEEEPVTEEDLVPEEEPVTEETLTAALPGADLIPMAYLAPPEWMELPYDQIGTYFAVQHDTMETAADTYLSTWYRTQTGEPRLGYYADPEDGRLVSLSLYDIGLWMKHPIGWAGIATCDTLTDIPGKLGVEEVLSADLRLVCHMYEEGQGHCGYELLPADENACPIEVVYHNRGGSEQTERFSFVFNGDCLCLFAYNVDPAET